MDPEEIHEPVRVGDEVKHRVEDTAGANSPRRALSTYIRVWELGHPALFGHFELGFALRCDRLVLAVPSDGISITHNHGEAALWRYLGFPPVFPAILTKSKMRKPDIPRWRK